MAYSLEQKEEVFTYIFDEMCKGRALRNILKQDEGMPNATTFYNWLDETNEEGERTQYAIDKNKQYARACELRADAIFDDIIDIADDSSEDTQFNENSISINAEFVARSRIRIDARKWIVSKLNPKKFGDKVDVTSDNKPLQQQAIQVEIVKPSNESDDSI